jgi:hypothetical protein
MTRRLRLLGKIRKQPQRIARKWRCREGRRLRAELVRVLAAPAVVSGPPDAPWADPAYQAIMRDIAENLADPGTSR